MARKKISSVVRSSRIPSQVRITKRITYNVLWTDRFKDPDQMAECDFDAKNIIIRNGLSENTTNFSYIHELFHAVSSEYNIDLTENQVERLEKAFAAIERLNR